MEEPKVHNTGRFGVLHIGLLPNKRAANADRELGSADSRCDDHLFPPIFASGAVVRTGIELLGIARHLHHICEQGSISNKWQWTFGDLAVSCLPASSRIFFQHESSASAI